MKAHAMPFGTALQPGGGVEFRLWAPQAAGPCLYWIDSAGSEHCEPASVDGGGLWRCQVPQAGAGTHYQWQVHNQQRVPDPASRWNPLGPLGPSVVCDPQQFRWDENWRGRPWHEAVVLEIHVGTFTPEGTFEAAARQLPALAALGITAVELMPVACFGGRFGWGYDGVLPFAPHPAYGTPDELKALVQSAHRLDLMVLLDVVYNHFGPEGNFLPAYAPGFFSRTHSSPWGPAINFDGPDSRPVREFFIHNALYWLQEFHFDGLRLDAVHAIHDSSSPDILEELSVRVREATLGRHVHLVLENERNQGRRLAAAPLPARYDAQWNDDFHHALHSLLTGETQAYYGDYAPDPLALLARTLTQGFAFEEAERGPDGRRRVCEPAPPLPLPAMINFAHNHDQIGNRAYGERLQALVPPAAFELALLLVLLTPATPLLFQGDELGADSPFLYFADWDGDLREAVRAGRRREFGHAERPGEPLPDACALETFERSRLPRGAPADACLARQKLLRAALQARREAIVPRQALLATGRHEARRVGERGLQLRWRYNDGAELWLDLNLGAQPQPLADAGALAAPPAMRAVFEHGWREGPEWAPWSARWRLRERT